MNTRNGATAIGLVKAFILAVSVATVARAGLAYLPLTGPATLRVLAVRPPKQIQTTVVAAKPPASAPDSCTNIFPETVAANPATNSAFPLPPLTMSAGSPLDVSAGTSIFMMASPDFLSVTPEMLAAYFTPAALGTNGVNGVVIPGPFHVGFVPPLLQVQKSSTAEYIVK
jgi:hypothetical protein